MRKVVLLGLFASGCLTLHELPISAGNPSIESDRDTWFQGERHEVWLNYPNAELCDKEDWTCKDNLSATMTVMSATCHGCTFVEDPTGKTGLSFVVADAIANIDGPISIEATLRFDASNAIARVASSVTGDHEVRLAAACALADSAALRKNHTIVARDLRDCDPAGKRSVADTVLVFPSIQTAHSGSASDFCTTLGGCAGSREISTVPPVAAWGNIEDRSYAPFIVMPPLDATTTAILLSVPLATGQTSTISLALPPLR
ncbi:MAG TPA: hypothetical protein VFP84_13345 [Kofleriaceae bacterium]|nr:hypothetical protein [Kofleriaceae bacterium]